jgi:hypothetical protein
MALGTQLLQLVAMLRDETNRSNSVAVGVDEMPLLKQALRRWQATLYDKHDWDHLRTVFSRIPLNEGQRFYDFPALLNFDRIIDTAVWHNGIASPFTRGIGFDEYSVYDSENDVAADPALRWDIRWTGTATQIEVWPVPASDQYSMQFIGIRKLQNNLINNSDRADLDDHMLVLFAASELLPKGSELAKQKLALGTDRFNTLKGNAAKSNRTFRMGSGAVPTSDRGRVTVNVSR